MAKLIIYGQQNDLFTIFGGAMRGLSTDDESIKDVDVFIKLPKGAFELLKTEPSIEQWDILSDECPEANIYRTARTIAMFLYAECRCRNISITRTDFDCTYEMAIGYVLRVEFTTYEGLRSNVDVVSLNYLAPRLADYDVNTLCYRNGKVETFLKDVEVSSIQENLRRHRARKCYQSNATENADFHDERFKKRQKKMQDRGYRTYIKEENLSFYRPEINTEERTLRDVSEVISRHDLPREEFSLPEGYNYVGRTAVFLYVSATRHDLPFPRDIEVLGTDIENLQKQLRFPTKRIRNTLYYEGGSITLHETANFLFDIYFLQFKDNEFSSASEEISFENIVKSLRLCRAKILSKEYVHDDFISMLNFSSQQYIE